MERSTQQNYSKINVTSQNFINYIDSGIVQLTQALAIEHQVKPDPEAKEMTRNIIQQRANFLLSDEKRKEIREVIKQVHNKIRENKLDDLSLKLYNLIKAARYDNI